MECDTSGHCSPLEISPPLLSSNLGYVSYGACHLTPLCIVSYPVYIGDIVTFSCEGGTLVGTKQIICMRDRDWFPKGDLPVCVTGCLLSSLNLSDLTLMGGEHISSDTVEVGKNVVLTCVPGASFDSATQFTVSCEIDEEWHGVPTSRCVKVRQPYTRYN